MEPKPYLLNKTEGLNSPNQADWKKHTISRRRFVIGASGAMAAGSLAAVGVSNLDSTSEKPNDSIKEIGQTENSTNIQEYIPDIKDLENARNGDFVKIYDEFAEYKKNSGHNNYYLMNGANTDEFCFIDQESSSKPEIRVIKMIKNIDNQIILRDGPSANSERIVTPEGFEGKNVFAIQMLGGEYENQIGHLTIDTAYGPYYGGAWYGLTSYRTLEDGNTQNFFCDLDGNELESGKSPISFSATFGERVA